MAIFRSYLAAQAPLIHNNGTNASRNPIVELSYGGATSFESTKHTRFLFQPDLSALRQEVADGRLRAQDVRRHEIVFKNVVALVPDQVNGEVEEARRGSGVTVFLRQLPAAEAFEEGSGYDYLFRPSYAQQQRAARQAPNWFYRTNDQLWATPGAWDPLTGVTLGECRVTEGTEDLRYDITTYVQAVLFAQAPEHPLLLQLDPEAEAFQDVRRFVITFFSRHTHHWFEPYLETASAPPLHEQRCELPLDEPAQLLLQIPPALDVELSQVTLYNGANEPVATYTGAALERVRPGLYRAQIAVSSMQAADGDVLSDEWTLLHNGVPKVIEQHFTVVDRLLAPLTDNFDRSFSLSVTGLRHNEVISRSQAATPRRVVVTHRMLERGHLRAGGCPPAQVQYRLYTAQGKEQLDVIPYESCYQVGESVFLELDTRWLIPQHYVLEIRPLASDGQQQGVPVKIQFQLVN